MLEYWNNGILGKSKGQRTKKSNPFSVLLLASSIIDEVVKSPRILMIVVPAPYPVRGKLQPGARREAE